MMRESTNQVLQMAMMKIHREREPLPGQYRTNCRIERVNGGFLCDVWFLTCGCRHDASGGCTMCNYGKHEGKVEWEEIVGELDALIRRLPWEFEDFLLTPSGSMLDDREITPAMRRDLMRLISGIRTKRFIVETRADTVTEESLRFIKEAPVSAERYIEIGLESGDNWILRNCVNKGFTWESYLEAADKIHAAGMYVTANIGLGLPFLTERMSVRSAAASIRRALKAGADSVVVFPYHIKKGTLLETLHRQGWYRCCSLWSLGEVLAAFSEEELQKIQISWYRDYFGAEASQIVCSPTTCPECEKEVLELLDSYRDTQSRDVVQALQGGTCSCRKAWEEQFYSQACEIRWDEVEKQYRGIARLYGIPPKILQSELALMEAGLAGDKGRKMDGKSDGNTADL